MLSLMWDISVTHSKAQVTSQSKGPKESKNIINEGGPLSSSSEVLFKLQIECYDKWKTLIASEG